MKLVRYGPAGREKPGIIDSEMLASGGLARIRKANVKRLKAVPGKPRLGACVGNVGNFIAIGLNYADHAAESGVPVPEEPVVFHKTTSCIVGPNDNTMVPKASTKLDYECELGVIIGRRARYLAKEKAMDVVAGYCIANDVSERAFQMEHGQTICKGKGAETFGPLGPWFVTKDEVRDPQNLTMWTKVNGATRQNGSTKTMVFDVAHLVWYLSQIFVLEPGDVIATGTPPGVAYGMKPPVYLKAGDVVELGIEKLGTQRQKIVPFKA